jgi:cytochrome c biogenesis protein CcmG/thiol:disulfide interchange protein DsbE
MKKVFSLTIVLAVSIFFFGCSSKQKAAEVPTPVCVTPVIAAAEAESAPLAVDANYAVRTKRRADAVKAIDFTLPDLKGGKVALTDYKSRVIILDFWATWCPPCRAEIPDFIALSKEYSSKNFVMIGAAVDDPNKVGNFVKSNNINYTICIADQATAGNYGGIRGIPTTFVIDREGYIVRQYVGFRPKEVFEQDIKDLM